MSKQSKFRQKGRGRFFSSPVAFLTYLFCLFLLVRATKANSPTANEGGVVIGIDLGTTYSCVGVSRKGKIEIIPNSQGNRITPSYVAFSPDKTSHRLVGDAAKNQASINPAHTVFDVKRLIGRKYTDPSVQSDKSLLPYQISKGKRDHPMIKIPCFDGEDESVSFAPEEISAMILREMKATAEDFLGEKVERVVVTVPAYFNNAQREATEVAGQIAGLKVERIINEPTAAAMAFGLDKMLSGSNEEESNVLVFDLGGGTFDVTLLSIDEGFFDVLATSGNTHLGGEDFDQRVMRYFMKKIEKETGGELDISNDVNAVQKLRMEVERAKRALSNQHQARLEIDDLGKEGYTFSETLTRARFEELNHDLFRKTLGPIDRVLKDAKLEKTDIDHVVLVGGSTRIPKIQEMVAEYFGNKQGLISKGEVNPDEAVAEGAAILGAVLGGDESLEHEILLLDVTSLSKGVETVGGVMTKVIERGSKIPTKKSQIFSTQQDNQDRVLIQIYEGERAMTADNNLLGSFELLGIPMAPRGVPQIEVSFAVDAGGVLHVSAEDKGTGRSHNITIASESGRLSSEDIESMKNDALRFEEEDRLTKQCVDAKNKLEGYLYGLRNSMEEPPLTEKLLGNDRKELLDLVDETIDWLEENPDAEAHDFDNKKDEVERIVAPILQQAYDANGSSDVDDFADDEL